MKDQEPKDLDATKTETLEAIAQEMQISIDDVLKLINDLEEVA